MTKEEKLTLKKGRLERLKNSEKNIKSGGVVRKLAREVRNLEK